MHSPDETAVQADIKADAAIVLRRFRMVFNAVKSHFRDVERLAGIGGAQLWALSIIQETPGIGISELSRALDIHQSTASNLVRALIERGLVASQRTATDRRTIALHVLDAGAKVLQQAPLPFAGVLPDALARLPPATLNRLEEDLGSLIVLLGSDEDGANTPLAHL